ncbi:MULTISPECIES: glycosyltransferase family 2 protein [unclassified Rhodococcus (in: high G+C Gram-positive bacteria)]|uniref:glycosyltransferase family 2 protein n=1 Tax=unclassified Rhodococcus (in: high G+C Gram-positive bacteria) TaxID=192944 RepID=UPI0020CFDC1C|nr:MULTISPECIES: glycosyltransferase family 2 protein [unclassified Rhodococcus (in: high G+C Gram-positive bacteria)]
MSSLTVIILTMDEEIHIKSAIESVHRVMPKPTVYVIDSGSSDSTVKIAQECGATVLHHAFVNQAKQFQWAMDTVPQNTPWMMRLDADEVISPTLADEISRSMAELPESVAGMYLQRRHVFQGRAITHGGRFPLRLLRVWRTGHAMIEDRWMDEHIVLKSGSSVVISGTFDDNNLKGIGFFTQKHNGYATREAMDVLISKYSLGDLPPQLESIRKNMTQDRVKRLVKTRIYNRIPYPVASSLYFLYRYILQLGFLDGVSGLEYHFLQGFWYRFLVGAKLRELESGIQPHWDVDQIRQYISSTTGYAIDARGTAGGQPAAVGTVRQ